MSTTATVNYQQLIPSLVEMGVLITHDTEGDEKVIFHPTPTTTITLKVTSNSTQKITTIHAHSISYTRSHDVHRPYYTINIEILQYLINSSVVHLHLQLQPDDTIDIQIGTTNQTTSTPTYTQIPTHMLISSLLNNDMITPNTLNNDHNAAYATFSPTFDYIIQIYTNNTLTQFNTARAVQVITRGMNDQVFIEAEKQQLQFMSDDIINIVVHKNIPPHLLSNLLTT